MISAQQHLTRFIQTVLLLFFCSYPLASNANGSAEELRHFEVYEIPDAGLIVYKPGSPAWNMEVDERRSNDAVILSTPNNYYPPASIEIRLDQRFKTHAIDLPEIAERINQSLREKTDVTSASEHAFKPVEYGEIDAYQNQFEINLESKPYTIRHTVGLMPSGHVITFMATTPSGMIDAIEPMATKIYANLEEITQ
ncbi:MAG: hypothetical protein ACPGSC_12250 [Granulosicoccaceae bacterium]